ncbi:MAG: methionine adenosyltransferase domain-containing protein, partial [Corynebacterium sp.]|nr:methionine adenosyltransferase domain-containing protein [Corynebacterium sp.]
AGVDFTPAGILDRLNLRRPIYTTTAAYGHFTDPDAPWEQPLAL